MSLAFSLQVGESRLLACWSRLPWGLALLAGALVLTHQLTRLPVVRAWPLVQLALLAVIGVFAAWWVLRPMWRVMPPQGQSLAQAKKWLWHRRTVAAATGVRLQVDDAGRLQWALPARPMAPASVTRVLRLPHLIVLFLTPSLGEDRRPPPWRVLLARDALMADDWRKVCVWLHWLERGPHDGSKHSPG